MDKIFTTVSTIFRERYGAKLFIENRKPHFNSRWQSAFVYSRTRKQVSFPIFNSRNELQAVATASPVDNQDAVIFDEMAQFLQLTIAEHFELTTELDQKIQTEMAIEKAHADNSKVIPLITKKKSDKDNTFTFKKRSNTRKPDLRPLWLTGDNKNLNSLIAYSVHEWTENWAFINANEIPDLIWEDESAWTHFSQITIFIPDVTNLDKDKVEKLMINIDQLKKIKGLKPLIVVSSSTEIPEDFMELRKHFNTYKVNEKNSAQVQAHFLLFHQKRQLDGVYQSEHSKDLFFLPFSPTPDKLH